jgi:hypothetical protein
MSGTGNLGANNGELELGGNGSYTCTYYYDDVQINSQGYPGPVPTGTVQFAVDGAAYGAAVTLSDGMAISPSTSTLAAGTHTVTATYSGDSNYAPSTGTLSQTISSTTGQVNFVNFETGNFSQCAGETNATIVTSPALDGTYSAQLIRNNSVANIEIRQNGATYFNLPTVYYSFLFEYTSNPGDGSIANFNDTASGLKEGLHLSPSDTLLFGQVGNWLGTGTTVLQPNQVYTLSIEISTGSNAPWQVRINGKTEMSGTGNLGANNGELELGGNGSYTCTYYYDDVQINSQGFPTVGTADQGGPASAALLASPLQRPSSDALGGSIAASVLAAQPQAQPVQLTSQPAILLPSNESVGGPPQPIETSQVSAPTMAVDAFFADWNGSLTREALES